MVSGHVSKKKEKEKPHICILSCFSLNGLRLICCSHQWPIKRHHSSIWYKSINAKYDSLQSHKREAEHKVNLKIELLNTVNLVCFSNIYIIMCLNWRSNSKIIMVTCDTTVPSFQCVTLVSQYEMSLVQNAPRVKHLLSCNKNKVRWFWQCTSFLSSAIAY